MDFIDFESETRALFRRYAPKLWEVVSTNRGVRTEIASQYERRYRLMADEIDRTGEFAAQSTLFDLLWNADDDRPGSRAYLAYIDELVGNLNERVATGLRGGLRRLCRDMILKFSDSRSEYYKHLSEIAAAEMLTGGGYEIVQFEEPLSNGKRMDFRVRRDDAEVLIEIFNIEFQANLITSAESFRAFLEHRITSKLVDKLQGADIPKQLGLAVMPVLWGETKRLAPYVSVLNQLVEDKLALPPMTFTEYIDVERRYRYAFQSVANFIESIRSREQE